MLKARPTGLAGPEHFATETDAVRAPAEGEALVETLYLSIDPAMRVWLNEDPGYVPPVAIGETMRAGGIGRVVQSAAPGLAAGDLVQGPFGWQTAATLPAAQLTKLDLSLGGPLDWIGPLGATGITAYFGLKDVGRAKPGETVLVSAASGAVGQMVGQIARLDGCRVIGIAGGVEKCAWLTGELGFDAAIDYKATPDLAGAIAQACPKGVDVYFDNVGGPTLDAALANMAMRGRVVICGRISQTAAAGEIYGVRNLGVLIGKRVRIEGFVVFDFVSRYAEARAWISQRLKTGALKQRQHIVGGLENAPAALAMLFKGENFGKLLVKVAQ